MRLVDFSSNDYLGLSGRSLPPGEVPEWLGATGSRLLSGNHPAHEALERKCAAFFRAEAALLFNSGYQANLGVLSALPRRGDTILYDERCHASIKDGLRLSPARFQSFRHNDLGDLSRRLANAPGEAWIVAEGLYSMDGDWAPLRGILELAEAHGAYVVLDEAHSTGVCGEGGRGLACGEGLAERVLLRVHTFGKAAGYHGAAVLLPPALKDYLVNRSRPFIYTTALPPGACEVLAMRLEQMAEADAGRKQLRVLGMLLADVLGANPGAAGSPIYPVVVPGNAEAKALAAQVRAAGFDVRPILSPTVPAGQERLRIVLHSFNTVEEVRALAEAIRAQGGD